MYIKNYYSLKLIVVFSILMALSNFALAREDKNTVGLWLFNENKGDVITDSSGNGLEGKQVGCDWVDGKFDSSALRFNKPSSYVEIPYSELLDLQEFSIEFWVKYKTPPAENVALMSNRGWLVGDKMTGFTLRDHGGSLYLEILTRGSTTTPGGLRVEDWQFIALTYDKTRKVSMYLDGELKKEQVIAGEIIYKGEGLWIGAEPGSGYLFGKTGDITIDDVRFSNIARTQDEIMISKEKGFAAFAVSPATKVSTLWGKIKK